MVHSWQIYRSPAGDLLAVKEGFNFHAFFLHALWCLRNGLHKAGTIALAILIVLCFLPPEQRLLAFIGLFAFMLTCGTLGNSWLISDLHRHQHRHLGTLKARTKKAAELEAKNFYTT